MLRGSHPRSTMTTKQLTVMDEAYLKSISQAIRTPYRSRQSSLQPRHIRLGRRVDWGVRHLSP